MRAGAPFCLEAWVWSIVAGGCCPFDPGLRDPVWPGSLTIMSTPFGMRSRHDEATEAVCGTRIAGDVVEVNGDRVAARMAVRPQVLACGATPRRTYGC